MGTDNNNGLKDFSSLVEHLRQMHKAEPETAVRRTKGPRTKKMTDEGCWTKLVQPETVRSVDPEYQPVSYTKLPALMRVERLPVRLFLREHKGLPQWQGQYRLYHKGLSSDYIDLVVNVSRFKVWPIQGVWYWVHPLSMAPKTRLVFADLVGEIDFERDFSLSSKTTSLSKDEDNAFLAEDDYWGSQAAYDAEVRANSEPPDYD